jgi:hypothetical protein
MAILKYYIINQVGKYFSGPPLQMFELDLAEVGY